MREPWIYISDPHYSVGEDGKRRTEVGIHGIFAVEVPFIPSFLSADFVGTLASGASRLQLIIARQIRFINDLAAIKENHATFDLRLVFRPPSEQEKGNQQPVVQVLFLGKVFSPGRNSEEARRLALNLWQRFSGHFPLEDPFNYPLIPIDEEWLKDRDKHLGHDSPDSRSAFEFHVLMPIALDKITADNLSEIRKFEDWDDTVSKTLGVPVSHQATGTALRLGYFVHLFRPTLDASGFSRLLETLINQQQSCLIRVSLRPTLLEHTEILLLSRLLSEYERQVKKTEGWIHLHKTAHLSRMQKAFHNLMSHQQQLFSINIQVMGEKERPEDVVAALGSEFISHESASDVPQLVQEVRPRPKTEEVDIEEVDIAKTNLRYLEHELWGETKGGEKLSRIPILVNGYEAAGAFRLPIPPESGYMPGIPVREEPFVRPQGLVQKAAEQLWLGDILHRGTASGEKFYIPLKDLRRHVLIAGSTGSGKTITCLNLLAQLWSEFQIPFLVIYPIAKPDYRILMADPRVRDSLLIFTAGDRPSPLRFNPFDIPQGVLLQTHISNMMRTFSAGMHMWGPLPSLFREALRQLYQDFGWKLDGCRGDDPKQRIPTLADFYEKLKGLVGQWSGRYRADLRGDLRQDSEVKIQDLLATAGSVLNVRYAEGSSPSVVEQILERPTVIEMGRVGSASDVALVVGFLVTLLGEHVFSRYRTSKKQHVTLIEEAHRLMSAQVNVEGEHVADPRRGGAEDFAHVLSEVRGFGEAIVIAEQTPTKLIPDAVGNTHVKVMHWLEERLSFELFAQLMNLNDRQRQHARTLDVGEVIVRSETGYPVLVKVPYYNEIVEQEWKRRGKSKQLTEKALDELTSDEAVTTFMKKQIQRLNLVIPDYEPWQKPSPRSSSASSSIPIKPKQTSTKSMKTQQEGEQDEDLSELEKKALQEIG